MGPRKTFSENDILDAACDIVKQNGWAAVSARSIAHGLGSSTMPIYSTLSSMDSLENAVRQRVLEMLFAYQAGKYSSNSALDQAIGYVRFARDEPGLFQFLFSNLNITSSDQVFMADKATESMQKEPYIREFFNSISSGQKTNFVLKNWIFLHGLAVLISTGVMQGMDDSKIDTIISETAEALYLWEIKGDVYPEKGGEV